MKLKGPFFDVAILAALLALACAAPPLARGADTKVAPIKVIPGATLASDFRKLHHAWCERVLIAPFKARLKGEPWNADAVAFVEKAVDDLNTIRDTDEPAALAAEGKKVIAAGCKDPLAAYLAARIGYRVERNWRPAKKTFDDLMKQLAADQSQSRALLCFIAKDQAAVGQRGGSATEPTDKLVAQWTKEALADGSYPREDDAVFLHHQLSPQWNDAFERNPKALAPIYEAADMPEWVQRTLRGALEVKRAWEARGGGWAHTVTEQGWKGFGEHLAKAKSELTQAWKLRPDRPEAATRMITVVMGGAGDHGEEERLWFDRAIAAQFDYMAAYKALLWAYRPRWGGSHQLMLAFGRACRDTRRYDTEVPLYFTKALNDIVSELDDWKAFYRGQPQLARELIEHNRALLKEPARAGEKEQWLSFLAVNAWLCGDYASAAQTIADLKGNLHGSARRKLRDLHVNPPEMLADLALHLGKGGPEFDEGEALYAKFALDQARARYEAAAKLADDKAAPLLRSRMAVVDFERALAGGEWVKITPSAELLDWTVRAGKWEADAAGTLINKGNDAPGLIVYRGRAGPDFEVRGAFEIHAPDNCCRTLGVAVGYHEPEGDDWINCTVYQSEKAHPIATILDKYYRSSAPLKKFKVKPKNEFLVRSLGGRITWQVNGETILENYLPPKGSTALEDGQIGFAGTKFCASNTTKITSIEVRRIKAQP